MWTVTGDEGFESATLVNDEMNEEVNDEGGEW